MRERLKQLVNMFDLRDAITFGGLGMVGYGIAMIHPPAAWITCGAVLFWLGVR